MPTIAPLRALRPARPQDLGSTWLRGQGPDLDAGGIRTKVMHGGLVRDKVPAYYRYEISFGPPEARQQATGFLCRLALDETLGGKTHEGGDPTRRMAAGHDVEPVVFRYEDPRGWVDEVLSSNAFDEVVRVTDDEGEHRLWRVERPEGVAEVTAQFEERQLRLEHGGRLLQDAWAHWKRTARDQDSAILALLAPEGPAPAPWRCGFVIAALDEPRPRTWQELAGDPGKPQWRTPPLG